MLPLFTKFVKICPKSGKVVGFKTPKGLYKLLFPLVGLAALAWILIRVLPKPSRLQYPCMRVAAPIATGFLSYLFGLGISVAAFRKASSLFRQSKYIMASVVGAIALISVLFIGTGTNADYLVAGEKKVDSVFVPTDPANTPIGTALGIFPGRVVWVRNTKAAMWDGKTGNWYDDKNTNQDTVDAMLKNAILSIGGKTTVADSWDAIFKYFNQTHGRGNVGYTKGEKVIIKVNLNWSSSTGMDPNTPVNSPQLIFSLIKNLVNVVGVQPSDITLYDLIRFVPDAIYNKCNNAFPGIHYMGWWNGQTVGQGKLNGRELYVRDTTQVHWSQKLTLEKDNSVSAKGGNPTYLAKSVVEATYMINLADMKAHRFAGVSLCAKSHVGSLSVDDDSGQPYIWAPHAAGVHPYYSVHYVPASMTWGTAFDERPMGTYNALVDLMGHKDLGGKTVLFLVDGLYAVESEQSLISTKSKWLSKPFNNSWTSMILASQDPVALESVGIDFYRTEQAVNPNMLYVYGFVDNYLHEAALANNPPSGTYYAPSGDGVRLKSLGVHEHWNNADNKQYTRNLGTGNGIELVSILDKPTDVKEVNAKLASFSLQQNYPNPFNPSTKINFSLDKGSFVTLAVYDVSGKEVKKLLNKEMTAGTYSLDFDGKNLPSGIYVYRLTSNAQTLTRKMLLLK